MGNTNYKVYNKIKFKSTHFSAFWYNKHGDKIKNGPVNLRKKGNKMKGDSSTNCWGKVGSEWIQKAQTNDFRMYYIMPWTLELLGDITGLKVLDLGCGEGGYAREMAHRGAVVTAIDCSKMAIEYSIAAAKEEQLTISHFIRNSNDLYGIADDSFDVVLCAMMMMDVEDLNGTLKEIRRVLKKQGKVFISILHPCFKPPVGHHWIKKNDATQVVVKNYFRPSEWQGNIAGIEQPVIYRHKTLSEYVKSFAENGFYISDINEPIPTTEQTAQSPRIEWLTRIPMYLFIELKIL